MIIMMLKILSGQVLMA